MHERVRGAWVRGCACKLAERASVGQDDVGSDQCEQCVCI